MLLYQGKDFKNFIDTETKEIKEQRDFVSEIEKGYLNRNNTHRGILLTGLRSTGKTVGILQALKNQTAEKIMYIAPTSRTENVTRKEVRDLLEAYEPEIMVLDEYSWLKPDKGEGEGEDILADYLAGQSMMGKKVIISGTDSARINALKNTQFIHRAIEINTTFFSYEEYCRLYQVKKNPESMREYLTKGGLFENHIYKNFGSMKDYIQDAIITNLSEYYPEYDRDLIRASIYTIFYECVCNCYHKNNEMGVPVYNYDTNALSYEDFLEDFGINPGIVIPTSVLSEIASKLEEIGVVVKLNDLRLPGKSRSYITNQTISALLTKCIYALPDLPDRYLGHLYEASVVCNVYMKQVHRDNSPYQMSYLHGKKSGVDYEIDYILHDHSSACLFECKMSSNNDIRIADTASLVKEIIPNLLGDKDIVGRFVIFQGTKDKACRANGMDIICTNNWDIDPNCFEKYLKELKGTEPDGGNAREPECVCQPEEETERE